MSNVVALTLDPDQQRALDFMGPARVLPGADTPEQTGWLVRRSDGREVTAKLALAFPYRPVDNDVLLIVGGPQGHFVIGVVEGHGHAQLDIAGDVSLRAVNGELSLQGDRGVHLRGPEVQVVSQKMKIYADAVVQKANTFYQHVRELWSVKSRAAHMTTTEDYFQRSRNATLLTEEIVTINGKQIHLG
ncbi:MAG: DUF3540 domain-containing protein [Myxococcota bacterium]